MAKRIKVRKKRNKTGEHTNNHWNDYSTDKEGSQLEVSWAGWNAGLLDENFFQHDMEELQHKRVAWSTTEWTSESG